MSFFFLLGLFANVCIIRVSYSIKSVTAQMSNSDRQIKEKREQASRGIPADDIEYHYEIIIFEVRHVCPQDVGLHFQLDILKRRMRAE